MKKLSFFLFFILLISCKTKFDVVRKIDKEHRNAPPGTVWIKDSIYMDMCEVRNLDYLEYTLWVKHYDSTNYAKVLPDTTVWRDKLSYNEPYVQYYFRHPAYRKHPVVGVSYDQVVAYCKWRTERVKEFAKLISPKSKYASSYKSYNYYYRLPTKEEWEYAASAGLDTSYRYGFKTDITKKNYPNIASIGIGTPTLDPSDSDGVAMVFESTVASVTYQKPNSFGLFNAIGNVAEMVSKKGVCKGGSWMDALETCKIENSTRYESPSSWLGFRCVCVVIK